MGWTRAEVWSFAVICLVVVVETQAAEGIPIVLLEKAAKEQGAVCLDGSPPAYFMQNGTGKGINNWLVLFEGGGWCDTVAACASRLSQERGSSNLMNKTTGFSGLLGSIEDKNPDFWNWNRVKVKYCDGASFTGDVEAPVEVNATAKLYFRGQRIFWAVMEDLLAKGMKNAENAILSGCSAGGATAILHSDQFKDLLPKTARVKTITDAGYFIDGTDINKGKSIEEFYARVTTLHGSAKNLPKCGQAKPEMCFFGQYVAPTMRTPLFLINSPYDTWQIGHILVPTTMDKTNAWNDCRLDINKCNPEQLKLVQGFRDEYVKAIETGVAMKKENGYFINSCYSHCQTSSADNWIGPKAIKMNNMDVAKIVGDWYFDRVTPPFRGVDPPYPSNTHCLAPDASTSA